ncbi:MAG: hypothetical protein LAO21_19405 [Acidobacteriia bacterium]|nr:hypothetical protein [Terriglobia bacterium]
MRKRQMHVARILLVLLLGGSCIVPSLVRAADEQVWPASGKEATGVEVIPEHGVKVGSISLGAFYSYSAGCPFPYSCSPYFWDPFYYGFWPSYWVYPSFYPAYHPGYFLPGQGGEVRLQTNAKTAEVYLNSAFAGIAGHLKSFWLAPGVYELEIRTEKGVILQQRIYVLTGKTIRVKAALAEQEKEARP